MRCQFPTDPGWDSVIANIIKQRDLMTAVHEHCKSLSARMTSRDKTVSVEVDGLAAMTGLWLGEHAYRNGADAPLTRHDGGTFHPDSPPT